jgi:predicted nuclease of predicted toxin-antitoxin system
MKFLVDAQLPRRLAHEINSLGGDCIHTLDLPAGNLTTDRDIIGIAKAQARVVVTKDADFVDSFLLRSEPPQLLHITTGNIPNSELIQIVHANWTQIVALLDQGAYVELSRTSITLHI